MTSVTPAAGPRARPALVAGLLLVLALLIAGPLTAAPAAAHAELVSSTPADGARLDRPPAVVVLRFTETVGLVDGGFRLLDDTGAQVTTPAPVGVGSSVRWRMPADLPRGRYVVDWRVVSDDGHPVAGAFSFGVGVAAPPATGSVPASSFSWPVVLVRFAGYLGFVLLLGAVAVAVAVWPAARRHRRVRLVLRVGATVAVTSTLLSLLLQGPYAAGEPLVRLFDRTLLAETAGSSFGAWTELRLYLLLTVTALTWPRAALESAFNRGFAAACLVAVAVSFSGTGHAAAGGIAVRAADSVHALAAGLWAGGLIVLTAASLEHTTRPDRTAWSRFSRLALAAVVVLVATGVLNAILRLQSVTDLWQSGYGRVLAVKVVMVAAAVTVGALSRRTLRRGTDPTSTVRIEAATTIVVLAITAALGTMTPPPASSATRSSVSEAPAAPVPVAHSVDGPMPAPSGHLVRKSGIGPSRRDSRDSPRADLVVR